MTYEEWMLRELGAYRHSLRKYQELYGVMVYELHQLGICDLNYYLVTSGKETTAEALIRREIWISCAYSC